MAIQNRRGAYADFDPTKMVPGEFAVVQNGDPLSGDGKSVYIAFNAGNVKRILLDDETMPEGFTDEIKSALLTCFRNVAWINDQGQTYYNALEAALNGVKSITLNTYSIASSTIGETIQLIATTVPAGGNVSWSTSDASVATVSSAGAVTITGYGQAMITASANGKVASCSVLASTVTLTSISAVYTQSGAVYDSDTLDSLKSDLVVTATWSDSTQTTINSSDYVLSGTLQAGTSVITVSYAGQTDTFSVTVTAVAFDHITAIFTQGQNVIYTDDTLDSLKQYLVVTAYNNDGTSAVVNDYTLSGTLTEGTSVITVSYGGQSATINVTVTGWDYSWDASSGENPTDMTAYSFDFNAESGALKVIQPNLTLTHNGAFEFIMECKIYQYDQSNNPKISISHYADSSHNYNVVLQPNAITDVVSQRNKLAYIYNWDSSTKTFTDCAYASYREYHAVLENGILNVYIDDDLILTHTYDDAVNHTDKNNVAIRSATDSQYYIMFIKKIRFRDI